MSHSDPVTLTREGHVAILRLNRPDRGNALDLEATRALDELVAQVDVDKNVRCVLLTGNGRFFCVGGDIAAFGSSLDELPLLLKRVTTALNSVVSRLMRMEKPLVVAVNGAAAGAGLGLACTGDIVLAAKSAHFTMAYTAIGLTPDGGTSWLLPRLIGLRRWQELAFTNRRVASMEAEQIGLVTRVVDDDMLFEEAYQQAQNLAVGPVEAFGAVRRLMWSGQTGDLETQLELESRAICEAAAGSEGRTGVAAFLEKRKPVFQS